MLILHLGVLVFIPSTHSDQMGVKEAGEHMFPLLFIQKEKQNLWVPGSSFQVPDPSFWVSGSGFQLPSFRSQLLGSGSRVLITLLPFFLAMYPDIPLRKT